MKRHNRTMRSDLLIATGIVMACCMIYLFALCGTVSATDAILRWDEPTLNTDSSPLTDLAGYKVYKGNSPGTYGTPVDIGRPASCGTFPSVNLCTYTVTGLTKGTWYFVMTAYDNESTVQESGYSNEVMKSVFDIPNNPAQLIIIVQ